MSFVGTQPDDNRDMVTLLEFSITCLISVVCPIFHLRLILVANKRRTTKLNPQLIIHLTVWLVFMITALFYALPVVLLWRGQGSLYNGFYGRVSGALNFGAMMVTPLSMSFLTIDRIITITVPTFPKFYRLVMIQVPSILTILFMYGNGTYLSFIRSRSVLAESECLIFSCYLLKGTIYDLMLTKFLLSWMNVFLGLMFIYLYCTYNRAATAKHERSRNHVIFSLIINEIAFSVFPTTVYLICDRFNIEYAARFGPFMTISHSVDILVSTIIFYRTFVIKANAVGTIRHVIKMSQLQTSVTEGNSTRKF